MKRFPPHLIVIAVLLLAYPLMANSFFLVQIGGQALILGIIALSVMMLGGWGGMVSLSQMTVAGMAGYMVAIFGTNSADLGLGLPWWLALPIALFIATAFATFIGAISVRTLGIHTIMITLAVGTAAFYFANQNYAIFNGFTGFSGLMPPSFFGMDLREPAPFYYLCLIMAALAYLAAVYLSRTPFGLALMAVRDNPRRMSAIGFNVTFYRIVAHLIAGVIAACGGVLFVWFNGRISPGTIGVSALIDVLVIAVIGGLRHPIGPFIGAVLFVLIETFAIDLIDRERFNTLIGLVFLVIVFLSPDGVLGLIDRARKAARKNKRQAW